MPRIEIDPTERDERFEEQRELFQTSTESFDRIAFAERAVALVRPPRTTVAICEGGRGVRLDAGRQWGEEHDARWAILRVPRNASRRAIASAVLGLWSSHASGHARAWSLDVLIASSEG